jgi:sugar transferase EpsL
MKRTFDVVGAVIGLVIGAPFMIVIALAVRLTIGGPVLFRQERIGLGSRRFVLLKFRTMRDGPEEDRERLTRLGMLLRRTSLDELPELWNVLVGEMSLVGPRPLLVEYLPLYSDEQARRHRVRPGVTGWAQVNGRNSISWDQKLAYDVWYVDHRSAWLDLRILALSIVRVLSAQGISQDGHATAEKFRGSAR